jgi:hypothetical protein
MRESTVRHCKEGALISRPLHVIPLGAGFPYLLSACVVRHPHRNPHPPCSVPTPFRQQHWSDEDLRASALRKGAFAPSSLNGRAEERRTRANRHSRPEGDDGGQAEHGTETSRVAIVSGGDPSEPLELVDGALDQVALLVDHGIEVPEAR